MTAATGIISRWGGRTSNRNRLPGISRRSTSDADCSVHLSRRRKKKTGIFVFRLDLPWLSQLEQNQLFRRGRCLRNEVDFNCTPDHPTMRGHQIRGFVNPSQQQLGQSHRVGNTPSRILHRDISMIAIHGASCNAHISRRRRKKMNIFIGFITYDCRNWNDFARRSVLQ